VFRGEALDPGRGRAKDLIDLSQLLTRNSPTLLARGSLTTGTLLARGSLSTGALLARGSPSTSALLARGSQSTGSLVSSRTSSPLRTLSTVKAGRRSMGGARRSRSGRSSSGGACCPSALPSTLSLSAALGLPATPSQPAALGSGHSRVENADVFGCSAGPLGSGRSSCHAALQVGSHGTRCGSAGCV
jgi:hypothetical protein